ncbi:PorT family protein [Zobellia amurskyensis]|uniref:PorT family protein n=1 Tax=Zobellia amurskyensis TaxID=248905 RepID=A0A7X2ZXB8_9FLAO|nr:porin family protein [Zobellia amurskyensis]MUH38113.1 PorT family protein [Zobellia amurskyensis]
MMRYFSVLFFLGCASVSAQLAVDSTEVDSRYLEDQFYIGITYNFLLNQPEDVSQRSLSYGLQAGFIKDIPLNRSRTTAIGLGAGYGVYSYYSNLKAEETSSGIVYSILESDGDFDRNKVETHMLEVPFEIRWRNSTAAEYKFWRLYAGMKFGYVFGGRSKLVPTDTNKISFYNEDIRRFQYGLTLNFGYNTFNLHAYYSLTSLFNDDVVVGSESLNSKALRIGLIFYIL